MPDYRFQSITTSGEARAGLLKGRDRADIVQQLSSRGETATEVQQVKAGTKATKTTGPKKRRREFNLRGVYVSAPGRI